MAANPFGFDAGAFNQGMQKSIERQTCAGGAIGLHWVLFEHGTIRNADKGGVKQSAIFLKSAIYHNK